MKLIRYLVQRRIDVGNNIVNMINTIRDSHQILSYSSSGQFFRS